MRFMPFDYRMGCVAVVRDNIAYVVYPNGKAEVCEDYRAAELKAQHVNLTATDKEREEWRC